MQATTYNHDICFQSTQNFCQFNHLFLIFFKEIMIIMFVMVFDCCSCLFLITSKELVLKLFFLLIPKEAQVAPKKFNQMIFQIKDNFWMSFWEQEQCLLHFLKRIFIIFVWICYKWWVFLCKNQLEDLYPPRKMLIYLQKPSCFLGNHILSL